MKDLIFKLFPCVSGLRQRYKRLSPDGAEQQEGMEENVGTAGPTDAAPEAALGESLARQRKKKKRQQPDDKRKSASLDNNQAAQTVGSNTTLRQGSSSPGNAARSVQASGAKDGFTLCATFSSPPGLCSSYTKSGTQF